MRFKTIAAMLAALPVVAVAAPTWQTISSEPGKRIELDRTSIKREDGSKVQAQGRVILEKELTDSKTGAGYRVIEAVTRYDCTTRNATTMKRIYKKNENTVIREEDINAAEMPVRSGTLDDKVLREVCRPGKESAAEVAQRANAATTQLKAANEELIKQELAKKTSEGAVIPSIRPNLKAAAEAHKAADTHGHAAPAPAAKAEPAPAHRPTALTVYTSAPKPKKAAAGKGGYMLEVAPAAVEQHAHIHWSYEGEGGPESWFKLDPKNEICLKGQRQSPIDIRDGIKVDLEPIRFDYRPSIFRIVDNGHTIQVNLADSSITVTGKTYELIQFHFHKPSEEKINGKAFDMVAHLVHKADDGQLAVVAVLMERGSENPFIQTLWNNMPLEKNAPVSPPELAIDPARLLPAGRNYYTYMGSLTTPPCSEGVLWLVLKQPVQISSEQIGIFSRLYPRNARPIQPAAGRLIKDGR